MADLEFLSFYDLLKANNQVLHLTFREAMTIAEQDRRRVWFVRETEDGLDYDIDEDNDTPWSVEPWSDQFVNCVGFFVSTEPRRAEHDSWIFSY